MKLLIFLIISFCSFTLLAQPGTLDASFGNGGKVTTEIGGNLNAATIQSDGKILVTGAIGDSLAVGRYLTNGNLDSSFGHNGFLEFGYGGSGFWGSIQAIVVQQDGKILYGGYWSTYISPSYLILSRLNHDGTPDESFGVAGVVKTNYIYKIGMSATSLALQPDGEIIVDAGDGLSLYVLRFLSNVLSIRTLVLMDLLHIFTLEMRVVAG